MQHLPVAAVFLNSKKAQLMRFLDVLFVLVLVSSFSPSGKYMKRLVYKRHQSYTLSTPASPTYPPYYQHMQLRDRGHSYTLPTCNFLLYKNSFINRCLFEYIV